MDNATKTAYVSPPNGQLDITIIRDANPRVTILIDLGIPNFTVFSMTLPLAEGQPGAMSQLIAEAVHVLLDEVASFMMSMEFDEKVIVNIYATVLATFKSMSTESDSAKEQDVSGQDPTVATYEGTFEIPMDFINETQKRVVTAAEITEKEAERLIRMARKLNDDPKRTELYEKAKSSWSREESKTAHDYQWAPIKRIWDALAEYVSIEQPLGFDKDVDQFIREKLQHIDKSMRQVEKVISTGSDEFYPMAIAIESTIISDMLWVARALHSQAHVREQLGENAWRTMRQADYELKDAEKALKQAVRLGNDPKRSEIVGKARETKSEKDIKAAHEYQYPLMQKLYNTLLDLVGREQEIEFGGVGSDEKQYDFIIRGKMKWLASAFDDIDDMVQGKFVALKPSEYYSEYLMSTEENMLNELSNVANALRVQALPTPSWQRVEAATKIQRTPKVRHVELTYSPKEKTKPSDTARVIRMYRNRTLKQQPRPMFVVVYDQAGRPAGAVQVGPGKNFKNELLRQMKKKGSIDFTEPVSFVNEQEMKSNQLNGIPRAISVGGMTYQPEAMSGVDMALYHGPQDYIVKFPDGRSAIFPGRPTFSKMRVLNFPVPRNRFRWTTIPEDALAEPKDKPQEVKEAGDDDAPRSAEQVKNDEARSMTMPPDDHYKPKDTVRPDMVHHRSGGENKFRGVEQIWLKPTRTYDDLVPLDQLKKRLERDKLSGRQIFSGLMLIDRIGYYGTFEGKNVLVIPQYYIRRYGVKKDDGTWQVYHLRSDGRAQKIGFRTITDNDFTEAKPAESIEQHG